MITVIKAGGIIKRKGFNHMWNIRFPRIAGRVWKPKLVIFAVLLLLTINVPFAWTDPGIVFAAQQDVPVLSVTASCDAAANGTFVITDTVANMTSAGTWTLSLNGTPIATNTFQLNAGASISVSTSGLFGTLVLTALGGGSAGSAIASTFCNPPTLQVTAKCDLTGNGNFVIKDIGASMTGQGTWTLTLNSVQIATNKFQLTSGQSTSVNTSGLMGELAL
jgi:hypothetical protein